MSADQLALPLGLAAAGGLVGAFAVMRRMALASDALSHVALPGIGLALILKINPVIGGVAALLAGTVLVWALERRTGIATEALIGVVFSTALAAGSLLASGEELVEALFGASRAPGPAETAVGLAACAVIVVFMLRARDRLVIALVSQDLARTAGIDVARLDLLYLTAFAVTVALGLRYLGVLLMGSLVIIPATTARYLARSLRGVLGWSVALAAASMAGGLAGGAAFHVAPGPLVITSAAVLFLAAVVLMRRR
ncbi:MAG TPA: metal ABC transporter permease [Gemmatimonadales bacterium]|nr:metal ABC transporter permease [Gemmatimonadales bacterium]